MRAKSMRMKGGYVDKIIKEKTEKKNEEKQLDASCFPLDTQSCSELLLPVGLP